MLSDRERRCLAAIEEHLLHSDPRLAARFRRLDAVARPRRRPKRATGASHGTGLSATRDSTHRSVHGAGPGPCVALAVAMVLLLAGAATGAMAVVVAGVVLALLTLGVAATTVARPGPGFA